MDPLAPSSYTYEYSYHVAILLKYELMLNKAYLIAGMFRGGKFGKFGESSAIHQTKTIEISIYSKQPFGQSVH